jgi:hypothetical protein
LLADDYYISYHYSVHNALLYSEDLYVSKAMKQCSGVATKQTLILENNTSLTLDMLLKKNYDTFINYLNTLGLCVRYNNTTNNFKSETRTTLTFRTHCFKVDFNDNFVKISPLK